METILYYAGHIVAVYCGKSIVDVFKVNGPLNERFDLNAFFEPYDLILTQINFISVPRLDWQDREFDT